MIEAFWSLATLVLLILLIVGTVKLGRLIKEKWGIPATVLFVFMVLILAGKGGKPDNAKSVSFKEPDHLEQSTGHRVGIVMQESLAARYHLDIQFGRDSLTHRYLPLNAYTSLSGFFYGYGWKPGMISVTTSSDNRYFHYIITGIREWRLFGTILYTENRDFSGKVAIEVPAEQL